MKILKAYKYRIYPNKEQQQFLEKNFGAVRFIWNKLTHAFNSYSKEGPNLVITEKTLKDSTDYSWLNECLSVALQQKRMDFDEAKKQYFSKTRKTKTGRMKFKKKGSSRDSFRIPGSTATKVNTFADIRDGSIKLPKMEPMKIIQHKAFNGEVKNITVSKTSNQYFVSILVEEDIDLKPMAGKEIGIDLGLTDLIITSAGHKFQRVSTQLEKTNQLLKKAQRKLSRKTNGSNSYSRQRLMVQKLYARITRIRNDYYHNIQSWLVENYDSIYLEDLNVNGMLKNRKMSRAIQEAAWSTLVGMIKYKANWYGKTVHQINRFFPSSKTCSSCGHKVEKMPLDIREWTCPSCGEDHDRDINAAINIRNQGQVDCYEEILPDGISGLVEIPARLVKYIAKIERSSPSGLVDVGTDEDTRSQHANALAQY